MIKGWITRRELLTNHDPKRWEVSGEPQASDRASGETVRESA
jgi:hypothetical protein